MFKTSLAPKQEVKHSKVSHLGEDIKKILDETPQQDCEDSDSDECLTSRASCTKSSSIKSRDKSKLSPLSSEEKQSKHKSQMKEWRSKNPEYNRTYRQKYYADHREEILEKRRQKRQEEKRILEAYKQSQVVN